MADDKRLICDGASVQEGGKGVRFTIERYGKPQSAFAIRYDGRVYAYINRCAHVPVELDWVEGEFFDLSGLYLVCSTHGATYLPESGRCIAGPCSGRSLVRLPIEEVDGQVFLITQDAKEDSHG
jgi:nitrite reductase/ring-hydroxylating ferredoxin subunit